MALSRRAKAVTAAVTVLAVGGGGWWGWKANAQKKKAAAAAEEETVAEVTEGSLEVRFRELGEVAAKREVDVASKVSGRIIELTVDEGARVKAGQKLAVIQPGKTGAEKYLPSEVAAPIDGIVLAYVKNANSNNEVKFVRVGDQVTGQFDSQSPTYLMTLADMRVLVVKMRINELDVLKLKEDMAVEVMVDALRGEVFPAKISVISPQAEKEQRGGRVFRVEAALEKPDNRLRTGMTARVDAVLEKREKAVRLPLTGLFEDKGAEVAYIKAEAKDAKPREVIVKTGMRTELEIEVLSGLKKGDKVVTEKPVEFDPADGEDLRKAAEARGRGGAAEGATAMAGGRRRMRIR